MSAETHVTEWIPAYALHSLDEAEAAQVAQHLVTCAACQAELAAYQALVGELALAVPEAAPPANLKTRLLADITPRPTTTVTPPTNPSRWSRLFQRPLWQRPLWQPAAAALILILLLGNLVLWQRAQRPKTGAFQTITLTGTAVTPGATGIIIISANGQHGTLVVQELPPLPEELAYQLWLSRDGQRDDSQRVSGGIFTVAEDGYRNLWVGAPEPLDSYTTFGITIEPAEGSPHPTGDKVLSNN